MTSTAASFAPIAAATGEPVRLAMQRLWLGGRILPAGAGLTVQHVFRSDEAKPLEVIYAFPLPRDAALRSFRITGDGFEAHSELRQTEEAVKAYEEGIAAGSLSTLARQYGDGIMNLTVGNIRPGETVTVHVELLAGVELRDDGFRFRFPFTLAPAYHSQVRAARSGDEAEMELPPDQFGDVILPRFQKDASSLHEVGFELDVLHGLRVQEIGSPSHSIRIVNGAEGRTRVLLATDRDVPNRDLVLDVRFAGSEAQVLSGPGVEGRRSFAAVLPSTLFGTLEAAPRRIVILLDRSGSMSGAPIAQARKAIEACLAVLEERDSFGLVAFDDRAEALNAGLVSGTRENRQKAREFLTRVDARGGTELAAGFLDAARILNGAGDIFILTDGQVFGSEDILAKARAANVRLSCLGIGSASQDRLLTLLARETSGVSRFVTARERVDIAAVDLFASLGRPVTSTLNVEGNIQPSVPATVFSGTPVLVFGEIPEGAAESLHLSWDMKHLDIPVPAGDAETGAAVRLLQGSRLITDWESRYPSSEAVAPLEKRKQSRVAARLAELSRSYGLASREMSLVAVVKRAGDRPGELPETRVVPVGMAQDTEFRAYFGGFGASPASDQFNHMFCTMPAAAGLAPAPPVVAQAPPARAGKRALSKFAAAFSPFREAMAPEAAAPSSPPSTVDDELMNLAAQLEPDGGMPGKTLAVRAARTAAAVLAFASAGHTATTGAFRSHVARLISFLKSVTSLSARESQIIERVLKVAGSGGDVHSEWLQLALATAPDWNKLEQI